jgi:hypothetical protein
MDFVGGAIQWHQAMCSDHVPSSVEVKLDSSDPGGPLDRVTLTGNSTGKIAESINPVPNGGLITLDIPGGTPMQQIYLEIVRKNTGGTPTRIQSIFVNP